MRPHRCFSGNNHFFKALIGMRIDEIVNEVAHQAVYVKNLIGDEVGLVHPLTYNGPHKLDHLCEEDFGHRHL
jgi:hypothetical protein